MKYETNPTGYYDEEGIFHYCTLEEFKKLLNIVERDLENPFDILGVQKHGSGVALPDQSMSIEIPVDEDT